MSFTSLSSKLYTIKSRKNTSTSDAFISMIREDMAMRFSVYSMAKSLTGSDFFASVLESKYGKGTPLERQEESNRKKAIDREKRFKQYTVDSMVKLNNKINTLINLTERNTALIFNLYNDLGTFRNQRKFTPASMKSLSAVRMTVRSRTVKYQIDDIRAQLAVLQQINLGSAASRRIRSASDRGSNFEASSIAAAAIAGGAAGGAGGAGRSGGGAPTTAPVGGGGSGGDSSLSLVDKILLGLAAKDAANALRKGYRYVRRKYFPTPGSGTASPVKPVPTTTASKIPQYDSRGRGSQYRIPKGQPGAGQFTKAPPTTAAPRQFNIPTSKATRIATQQNMPSSTLSNLVRRLPPGVSRFLFGVGRLTSTPAQIIGLIGAGTWDILSGKTAGDMSAAADKVAETFGMKLIKGSGGTTTGYSIDGKVYKYEELPQEYKDIIDAFISPDRVAKNIALQKIASNPDTYEMLKTYQGRVRATVSDAPESSVASEAAIAAAKAASLVIAEPNLGSAAKPTISASQTTTAVTPTTTAAPPAKKLPADSATAGIPIDFKTYSQRIAALESAGAGGYKAVNRLGYLGKYQLGAMALQDLGLVKSGTTLKQLDDPTKWNIEGGKQAFLNDANLQEETFARYTKMNYSRLVRLGVISAESSPSTVAGYLAAAHLVGPGGAKDLKAGVVKSDAFGTKASVYYNIASVGEATSTLIAATKPSDSSMSRVSMPPSPAAVDRQAVGDVVTEARLTSLATETQAALMSIDSLQKTITTMSKKVLDIEKQVSFSTPFPSVRNDSLA